MIIFYKVHIKEEILKGQWMLNDVALPLIDMYKINACEIVLGYDQQKFISSRATCSIVASIRKAENDPVIIDEKIESLL